MPDGDLAAIFKGLAEDAGQAGRDIGESMAHFTESTAEIEDGNAARTLAADAENARAAAAIGKDAASAQVPGENVSLASAGAAGEPGSVGRLLNRPNPVSVSAGGAAAGNAAGAGQDAAAGAGGSAVHSPAGPDPQYQPGTPEYQARIDELSRDPAKGGKPGAQAIQEAKVGLRAERDGQLPGPIRRAPFDASGNDQGEFIDASGQRWDVKSSPDLRPSYRPNPGTPIRHIQGSQEFTDMINGSLSKGENVILDPDGMSASRLAHLQELVAGNPVWQGKVIWGS